MKQILLINPPIYDFTAFDLWAKPLGLLYISSILKKQNINVYMFDYMDRHFAGKAKSNIYGCGHYFKQKVEKPKVFDDIPRFYYRHGIAREQAELLLQKFKPDIILITSIMTYWYLGVVEAIETMRKIFPGVPIAIGGVYATLCDKHLSKFNPDYIVKGSLEKLVPILQDNSINAEIPGNFSDFPIPDYSFYDVKEYIALRYSLGCPFRCTYCAQNILCDNKFDLKNPETVYKEIEYFAETGIKNFAFYDDALFYKSDTGIKPLLKMIVDNNLNINIHTPNGLHVRYLDKELAKLMKRANFVMPRFSLESSNATTQRQTGGKVDNLEFENAIEYLRAAGYRKGEYLAYLLLGVPNQSLQEVKDSIDYLYKLGTRNSLSEYSLIPKTKIFESVGKRFEEEPLLHNNSIFPMVEKSKWGEVRRIKEYGRQINERLRKEKSI